MAESKTLNQGQKTAVRLLPAQSVTISTVSNGAGYVCLAGGSEIYRSISSGSVEIGPFQTPTELVIYCSVASLSYTVDFSQEEGFEVALSEQLSSVGISPAYVLERHKVPAFETFSKLADWTASASNAALSVSAEADGINLSSGLIASQNASITQDQKFSLNTQNGFWLLLENNFRQTAAQLGMTIYLSHAAGLGSGSGRWQYANPVYSGAVGEQPLWVPKSGFTVLDGSPDFANDLLSWRFRLDSSASETHDWTLKRCMFGGQRPAVVMTFDDGWTTSYTIGHAEAKKREIPLTHYLIENTLDVTNFITTAQAWEMKNAGDYIGLHGEFRWDQDLPRLSNEYAALKATGLSDCKHAAYPEGQIGYGETWRDMTALLQSLGVESARLAGGNSPTLRGYGNPYCLTSYPLNNSISLAQAQAAVDLAVSSGGTVFFYPHKLGAVADSLTWVTADYTALLDYIAAKRDLGQLDTLTAAQWWDR